MYPRFNWLCTIWLYTIQVCVLQLLWFLCYAAGRSPAPESQLATPTSMEVLEIGGGVADEEEGVVLSWGRGGRGSANDPLVISSNDDLEGEDSEVITAFSGQCTCIYMILYLVQ